MSERDQYVKQLKAVQAIREIAPNYELRHPQICVVGDQSSGKSSVLECITGIPFPTKSGICTKAAIVVQCVHNPDLSEDMYEIKNTTGKYRPVAKKDVAKEILLVQDEALAAEEDRIGVRPKISATEIHVRVSGASQIDVVVVDLPGIINQVLADEKNMYEGDGVEEVKNLINAHIKHPETLVLLVSEAKQDPELVTAIGLAKRWDVAGERTLRILNKFDTFDSEDASERAITLVCDGANESVRKSGCVSPGNASTAASTTSADDDESSDMSDMQYSLAPHALICKFGGLEYNAEMERKKLQDEYHLPKAFSGVASLKARLPSIYANLIRTNLPALKKAIEDKLTNAKDKLKEIGEEPADAQLVIFGCLRRLEASMNAFEEKVTPALTEFQEKVKKTGDKITAEMTNSKLHPNAYKCMYFHGGDAFNECLQDIVDMWEPILLDYCKKVEAHTLESFDVIRETEGLTHIFFDSIVKVWKNECGTQLFPVFQKACQDALFQEADFGTLNHYLDAKYQRQELLPDALINEFLECVTMYDHSRDPTDEEIKHWEETGTGSKNSMKRLHISEFRANLRKKLETVRNEARDKRKRQSVFQQQQDRLLNAVKACWGVEKKTFVDMVQKCTRTHLLNARKTWITQKMHPSNETLCNLAQEDEFVVSRRAKLKDEVEKMQMCLDRIDHI